MNNKIYIRMLIKPIFWLVANVFKLNHFLWYVLLELERCYIFLRLILHVVQLLMSSKYAQKEHVKLLSMFPRPLKGTYYALSLLKIFI